ncbi:MAG: hypothetical protein L3K10_07155 [Thermoplasmata archaeon]|nr:hypothetical protein [Thermoplasmata archaeon]
MIVRASRERHEQLTVALGSSVREAVRRVGLAPEGSAVLIDDVPVPLDLPIERALRLVVLPTFSGG